MTEEKRNDEIDLIEVFQKIGTGIKNLFNGLMNILYQILLFFIRRSILIIIITILFLAFGYFKFKTSPRYYSSSIEAISNAISSVDMINYVNNINELFKSNNKVELIDKLSINQSELNKIKNIKAFKAIDLNNDGVTDIIDYDQKYSSADTLVSPKRFVVRVEVFDPLIFPVIQKTIIDYINRNSYITELNKIRKEQLINLIEKVDDELVSLDSLKKTEYYSKENQLASEKGQLLIMNEKEPQLLHNDILTLYKQRQSYEKALKLNTDAITVIQDFSALSTIENNIFFYIKKFGLIGIVIGILLSIIVEKRRGILKIISDARKK